MTSLDVGVTAGAGVTFGVGSDDIATATNDINVGTSSRR
jgi:hypothetical protein